MFHIYKGTRISPSVKESSIDAVEKFRFRDDDVLIATYPKSGTHWINEITQLIRNDGDPTRLTHNHRRTPLEITDVINLANVDLFKASVDQVQTDPSPRVLITHLRPQYLPEQTWAMRIPIIYVLRNPMDIFLSLFEFICNFILPNGKPYMTKDDWSDYMKLFVDGDGTRIPPSVKESSIDAVEKFHFRGDDILIATYPKSGTHWVINKITHLIIHGRNANLLTHRHRRTPLENIDVINLAKVDFFKAAVEQVQTDPSPRVLVTHLRPHHFPEQIWSMKIPIIYVLRDPMDVFLSLFEFVCNFVLPNGEHYLTEASWDNYMKSFISGDVVFDCWCDHVIQYEELVKRKENILFLTYEEMKEDIRTVIKRIAEHIRHDITDDIIEKVAINSTLEAMKVNYGKTMESRKEMKIAEEATSLFLYVKKGIAGRWRTEYPPEKWKPLQDAFKERVKDTIYAKQYFDY